MDAFSSLPDPILVLILKYLPDFTSLDVLIHASPVMSSIFDRCAAEIIENVASRNMSSCFRYILQHAGSAAVANETWSDVAEFHSAQTWSNPSKGVLKSLPIPVLRRLVTSASNVEYLCHIFLHTHLHRIHSMKPTHLLHPGTRLDPYAVTKYDPALAGLKYSIPDTGPPSWVEIQRVLRALWRLSTYYELGFAMPLLQSKPGEQTKVQDLSYQDFWTHLPWWEIDEMECVYEHLIEIGELDLFQPGNCAPLSRLPPGPLENEDGSCRLSPVPQDDALGNKWGQSQEALQRKSPASHFFLSLCHRGPNVSSRVLGGATWQSFRRLGFGFWDLKRMSQLEMMNPPLNLHRDLTTSSMKQKPYTQDDLKFTWMSVLSNK
ncbi:hypothetical protein BP6252_11362 [Coleophoma cylindrospora]|uniref:F-box domain-containing protein n=1 Tax=Coleophoma cylindrospora TaxID=1849047 RepID=A0A3D8QPV9_9HELO|nr:hypothetical protein BP6252_11362 [Coleophoma cylindrospora]